MLPPSFCIWWARNWINCWRRCYLSSSKIKHELPTVRAKMVYPSCSQTDCCIDTRSWHPRLHKNLLLHRLILRSHTFKAFEAYFPRWALHLLPILPRRCRDIFWECPYWVCILSMGREKDRSKFSNFWIRWLHRSRKQQKSSFAESIPSFCRLDSYLSIPAHLPIVFCFRWCKEWAPDAKESET